MFITVLFTIAKTGNQPERPSTEEQIKKTRGAHTGILLSREEEQNNAIRGKMDATRDFHIQRNKSEKEMYHMISLIYEF